MNRVATLGLLGAIVATLAAVPATSPSSQGVSGPATTQTQAVVDPAALPLLERLAAAYAVPGPLHVVGDIVGEFDVAGRRKTYRLHVDGRTDGNGRFRHDAAPAGLIVNDGEKAYFYDQRRDAFATFDATATRQQPADVDPNLINILLDENPALLLTLTDDPAGLLRRAAVAIRPATQPGALVVERASKHLTLRLREADGTIASSEIDFAPLMASRRASGVVAARAVLTYALPTREPSPPDAFAWQPPETATEFGLPTELIQNAPATAPSGATSRQSVEH